MYLTGITCAARIDTACTGMAEHEHHRQLRRSRDDRPENLLPVCAGCHRHIHREPRWAQSWGLIVSQYDDPADVHPHQFANPHALGPEPIDPDPLL